MEKHSPRAKVSLPDAAGDTFQQADLKTGSGLNKASVNALSSAQSMSGLTISCVSVSSVTHQVYLAVI